MSYPAIVGIAGSFSVASKTRTLVDEAVRRAATKYERSSEVYDLSRIGREFGVAHSIGELDEQARHVVDRIVNAKALVVATPVYKGSYPGLFKHLFDLIEPQVLAGKPVLLAATGGGDKHALIIEHQLRPLFAFFEAHTLATGIYAAERDFTEGRLSSAGVLDRLDRAVAQFQPFLDRPRQQERNFNNVSHLRLLQETGSGGL